MNRVLRKSLPKYLCKLQMDLFLSYYKTYSTSNDIPMKSTFQHCTFLVSDGTLDFNI